MRWRLTDSTSPRHLQLSFKLLLVLLLGSGRRLYISSNESVRTTEERKRKERGKFLWGFAELRALHCSSKDRGTHTHTHSECRRRKPAARREFVLLWIRVTALHWTSTHTPPTCSANTHSQTHTDTKSSLIASLAADALPSERSKVTHERERDECVESVLINMSVLLSVCLCGLMSLVSSG